MLCTWLSDYLTLDTVSVPWRSANRSAACQVWEPIGNTFPDWESCSKAAELAMVSNPLIHIFTWWVNPGAKAGTGACWFSKALINGTGGPEKGHVMGYKGPSTGMPAIKSGSNYNQCVGDCDCGDGKCDVLSISISMWLS